MSQVQRLIDLFDSVPLEHEFGVMEILRECRLGPAMSRRIADARYGHYLERGFLILNREETREGANLSFYRKVVAANYPAERIKAIASRERWLRDKERVRVPVKSSRQETIERFEREFHYTPRPAEPETEWSLT